MKSQKIVLAILLQFAVAEVGAQARFPGNAPVYEFQNPNIYVDVPSPEVSSLGKYGDVGVSYFTGTPNISIPLYNMTVREVTMPVSLDYDASGVRINSLPTWAGQNWTLNIGGVITRTVKGFYDEWIYPSQAMVSNFTNYFQCHDKLEELLGEGGDYHNLKSVLVHYSYDLSPDEYSFHFMGKSGKFVLDTTGNWRVQSDDNLEVIFDYNDSTNFISPLFPRYPSSNNVSDHNQRKTIAGFTIRDDKGNSYQFGYNRNAIEYTTNFWHMSKNENNESWHAQSWYLTKVSDKYGNILFTLNYERSAYIIQIFNSYYRDTVRESGGSILYSHDTFTNQNGNFPYTISICSPVSLVSVRSMNGLALDITSSYVNDEMATENIYKSIYRKYGQTNNVYNKLASLVQGWGPKGNGTMGYDLGAFYYLNGSEDEISDTTDSISKYRYNPANEDRFDVLSYSRIRKLNTLKIYSPNTRNSDYIGYRFCMSYANRRLKLDSLMVQNSAINYTPQVGVKGVYRFFYDNFESLPSDYLTSEVDHWGYYNGVSYYNNQQRPKDSLETVRNPNFSFTPIGVLNKIQYPTGGVSVFEYEPNTYGIYLTHDRQSVVDEGGIGGGLRIRSIKEYDSSELETPLRERTFSYVIPGTSKSSGELFAIPIYNWNSWRIKCESNNAVYNLSTCHTSSIVPLANSSGTSLGYSYVTETVKDLSTPGTDLERHTFRFSNLSNPSVRDQKFLLTFGYADEVTPFDEFSELGFKRGRLLSETLHDKVGRKVHSVGYCYRSDDCLSSNYLLTSNLRYENIGTSAQYAHFVGGIYKQYYPKYDIIEVQDTVFDSETTTPLVTITSYEKEDVDFSSWIPYKHEVNLRLILSEDIRRSNFHEMVTYHFGNFESSGGNDSILYKGMSFIQPQSIAYSKNGQVVSRRQTSYRQLTLNGRQCLVPSYVTATNCYEKTDTITEYLSYSSTGKPLSYKNLGEPTTYMRWAVGDNYLTLKGDGYIPFEISDAEFYDAETCRAKMLRYLKPFAYQITGYVYNPLFGPVSVIQPNGNETSYKYDTFGRLTEVYDHRGNLQKEYQYHIRK